MKLKTQIVLALISIIALIAMGLAFQQIRALSNSIAEETDTAGSIGTQMLSRVNEIYQTEGVRPMQRFLTRLGHLPAHDIMLLDQYGFVIYRTPASNHLQDNRVPWWFSRAVSPRTEAREFNIQGAKLLIRTDSSRAVLKAWQDFKILSATIVLGFILLSLLSWWLVDRALRPFDKVNTALRAVGDGDYHLRLPELPGAEAKAVGRSFNNMISNLETSMAAIEAEAIARSELRKNRELTQKIRSGIEQEHRALARELHDELGQHVTGIKSLGMSLIRRNPPDSTVAKTANHIVDSANSLHAAIRHMLIHLRPASLDQFGLTDAMQDLVGDWIIKQPSKSFTLQQDVLPDNLDSDTTTAVYRVAQEALTNAVRHSGADRVEVKLTYSDQSIFLTVSDNGQGFSNQSKQGFGITGMEERAAAVSGKLEVQHNNGTGCIVHLELPCEFSDSQSLTQAI